AAEVCFIQKISLPLPFVLNKLQRCEITVRLCLRLSRQSCNQPKSNTQKTGTESKVHGIDFTFYPITNILQLTGKGAELLPLRATFMLSISYSYTEEADKQVR